MALAAGGDNICGVGKNRTGVNIYTLNNHTQSPTAVSTPEIAAPLPFVFKPRCQAMPPSNHSFLERSNTTILAILYTYTPSLCRMPLLKLYDMKELKPYGAVSLQPCESELYQGQHAS